MVSISILPDRKRCDACGELMEESTTWHPGICEHVASWECPECGHAVVRDADSSLP